jgi:hypothetical protein
MVSSGPYFQAWCERLFRRYNILSSQHGFAELDKQFEKDKTDKSNSTTKQSGKPTDKYLEDAEKLIWSYDGFLDDTPQTSASTPKQKRKLVNYRSEPRRQWKASQEGSYPEGYRQARRSRRPAPAGPRDIRPLVLIKMRL